MAKKEAVSEEEVPKKKKKKEAVSEEEVPKKKKKKKETAEEETPKKKKGRVKDLRSKAERIKARASEEGFNKYGLRDKSAGGVVTNALIKATARKKNSGATRDELIVEFENAGLSRAGTKVNPETAVTFWTAPTQMREMGYTVSLDPDTGRYTISDGAPSDKDTESYKEARQKMGEGRRKMKKAKTGKKSKKGEGAAEEDAPKKKKKKKGKKSKKSSDE